VPVIIQAEAKSGEAQLKFLDNLFAHPAFGKDADITRETIDEEHENRVRFDVRVTYIPAAGGVTVEEKPVVEETTPAPTAPPAARDETEIE
jgi:predicted ThiF/HesA family dinucleotide-utilizing enzyme